jgi:hypothetical protein
MSAAVNIKPLVPAAMMTGSTILANALMVVPPVSWRRVADAAQYADPRIQ